MSLNPLTAIASLLTLVPKIITGVADLVRSARSARRPPVTPIPFNRPHAWSYGLSEPPLCAVCKATRTSENAKEMCDGPPPHYHTGGAT